MRASGPVFMFCTQGLVFGGAECVGSRFHVLRSRNHFQRYRGRRVPFACFVLPDLFSAVPRASGPVFMFCAKGIVFGGTEGVGTLFHVLRSRTHFVRYRERRVPYSCFALQESFSAVLSASGSVFMFSALKHVFGGTEGVGSRFHVLRSRIRFRRYQGRRVPFSCFVRSDSFSAVPRASFPVFMLCAPGIIFEGTGGVRYLFMLCAPELVFGGTKGVGSRFHVFRSRNRFRRY
jgi:hypothetical protein